MSAAAGRPAGPVEEHVAALSAALHGPARVKSRLVGEIRDGLGDAVAARVHAGEDPERAAREAVREFGTVGELVPSCQRELTIAQARHTARAIALTAPFLLACWYLIVTAGPDPGGQLPRVAQLLAAHLAAAAATAALLAAAALATTGTLGRRLPAPRRLPVTVAWTGTAASAAMAVATLTLATTSPLADNWPLIALAGSLTAASHGVVATSARACRRCARLPGADELALQDR
ncbi:permease prefix domain 1-containing protein [Streptomyces litchfieldiae]|uniref:Permease prefix domain 1-containing protein n=1 Tax=Streptomyces litchfieldiae TaxID=3075543 RepID=A0ABU2MMV2_9ACTN|nr:permease prefix domain 1-containing protein [Streptomyces sp. DSM 44938]MDT0342688.1 permease prefix domain 1-containing protein [Streptomyces sp. DSM 44938]